jgi:hypothetical protein
VVIYLQKKPPISERLNWIVYSVIDYLTSLYLILANSIKYREAMLPTLVTTAISNPNAVTGFDSTITNVFDDT